MGVVDDYRFGFALGLVLGLFLGGVLWHFWAMVLEGLAYNTVSCVTSHIIKQEVERIRRSISYFTRTDCHFNIVSHGIVVQ